jgi:hypothetical protein
MKDILTRWDRLENMEDDLGGDTQTVYELI